MSEVIEQRVKQLSQDLMDKRKRKLIIDSLVRKLIKNIMETNCGNSIVFHKEYYTEVKKEVKHE